MVAVQNCCSCFPFFFLLLRTDLSSSLHSRTNMLANMRMAASGMSYIKFTRTMRSPARCVYLLLLFCGTVKTLLIAKVI